jgi:hypothetical protein
MTNKRDNDEERIVRIERMMREARTRTPVKASLEPSRRSAHDIVRKIRQRKKR